MKEQKKTEIKVGITVLVGLFVLLWVLGWAKNFSFDSNEKRVSVEFETVAGLNVGDQVSIKGIKKGDSVINPVDLKSLDPNNEEDKEV